MRRMVGHMSLDSNPFEGRRIASAAPETVLHRFLKAGGRVGEIRERRLTRWKALEFLVYIDGNLHESWMFYGARLNDYPDALAKRCAWFTEDGWTEDVGVRPAPSA